VQTTSELERLYQAHGAALVLFGTSLIGERSIAQDAVQQVFLRLIQDANLPKVSDSKAYLFASVRNQLLNDSKVRNRTVDLTPDSAWFEPPERDYAAEESLKQALRQIPDDQRQVVVLRIWGELTFSQIADVLEINSNTAASRYRYAIEKLRDEICPMKEKL
jgi:RNA polymerase sigma-70 factor, ECF subfamily